MDQSSAPRPTGLSVFSLLAVIVSGLIPIWGVLHYGWDVVQIVVLFWVEALMAGVFAWLRIRDAERNPEARSSPSVSGLFLVRYGLFLGAYGLLAGWLGVVDAADSVWALTFGDQTFGLALIGVGLMLVMVHWRDWARPEAWREADPSTEMSRAYVRVAALHLAVIAGLWIVALTGGARNLVILLCAARLVIDVGVALWQAGGRVRFEAVR